MIAGMLGGDEFRPVHAFSDKAGVPDMGESAENGRRSTREVPRMIRLLQQQISVAGPQEAGIHCHSFPAAGP